MSNMEALRKVLSEYENLYAESLTRGESAAVLKVIHQEIQEIRKQLHSGSHPAEQLQRGRNMGEQNPD